MTVYGAMTGAACRGDSELAQMERTTGHVVTVCGGNVEASLREAGLEYDTLARSIASIRNVFAGE